MGYVLYGAHGSGSSIVEAVFQELGVDYRLERVDAARHAQRGPAYTAVNPHRKLPTLITPSQETITESVAIVLTLLERHPEPALLPPVGTPERALALRWMLFSATELYPLVELLDYPERFTPASTSASDLRERVVSIWQDRWLRVEEALPQDGPYLLGETFSATDVYVAALSRWVRPVDWRKATLPKVERSAGVVWTRPALVDVGRRNFKVGVE